MAGTNEILASARGYVRRTFRAHAALDDGVLDRVLAVRSARAERRLDVLDVVRAAGGEQVVYTGAPYVLIRAFLRWAQPRESDVVYDLGAGYGRVLLYGAVVTDARYRGIEIVRRRAEAARRCAVALGLSRVEVRHGNVRSTDFSDGTIFFLFNPFFRPTLRRVMTRLRDLCRLRPLRIATIGVSSRVLAGQSWLIEESPAPGDTIAANGCHLRLFRTGRGPRVSSRAAGG
jgi:SAM-dependent methyltransferase